MDSSSLNISAVGATSASTSAPVAAEGVVDAISKVLNLGTDASNHINFWTYSIQGEYAVVNCKPEISDFFFSGSDEVHHEIPENMTLQNKKSIIEATSTIVHLPSMTVVRRGLIEGVTLHNASFQLICENGLPFVDHRDGTQKTVFSPHESGVTVTFHPKYEGVMVYVWMHNGNVFFSTKKKLDARNSRHGNSRLLSELYDSLGGPSTFQLFPDSSEADGENVMYVFTIVHPSLFTVSKHDVGEGFILFNGAFDSRTLQELDIRSSRRAKWFHQFAKVGESEHLETFGESVVVDPSVPPSLRFEDGNMADFTVPMPDDETIPPIFEDVVNEMMADEIEKTLEQEEICVENGIWAPFPPPSKAARPLPPKGDADEVAAKALGPYEKKVKLSEDFDERLLPPVYTWFSFENLDSVRDYLEVGMMNAHLKGVVHGGRLDTENLENSLFTLLSPGEPVVLKVTDKTTGVPVFYTLQPQCNTWKTRITGSISNTTFRAGELRTLSSDAASYELSEADGLIGDEDAVPEYYELFMGGVPLLFLVSSARVEFLLENLIRLSETGNILFTIPSFVKTEMMKQLEDPNSLLSVKEKEELDHILLHPSDRFNFKRRAFFGWACVNLGLVSSPRNQLAAFKSFGEIMEMENKVAAYLESIYSPLVFFYLGQARQNRYGGRGRGLNSLVFSGFAHPEFRKKDGSFNMKLIDEIRDLVFKIRSFVNYNVTHHGIGGTAPFSPKTDDDLVAVKFEIRRCVRSIEGERLYTLYKTIKTIV